MPCRDVPPAAPRPYLVDVWAHLLDRHLAAGGHHAFACGYAPCTAQVFALDTQPAVLGGRDADDVPGAEPDLGERPVPVFDEVAFTVFDLLHVGAERGEESGFAFDGDGPRIRVGGGDDAPFAGVRVGEDPFGEEVRGGPRLPGPTATPDVPFVPVAWGW